MNKGRSSALIKRRNKGSSRLRVGQMITGIYDDVDCCKKNVMVLNIAKIFTVYEEK
jgi:hypothetical protein